MGQTISDATGKNYSAGVDSLNQLNVSADHPWTKACRRGDGYLWQSASADIDTGDTMCLVRNDDSNRLLVVHAIYIRNGNVAATTYDIHYITAGFTAAGTAITGINMLAGAGAPANVTAYGDETGNTQGTVLMDYISVTAAKGDWLTENNTGFCGGLHLAAGTAIAVDQITESTAGIVGIYGYFVAE